MRRNRNGCCRSLLHFAFKFYMNNFLLFIPMFIQSFRCHVFSVSFSFESRKTLYSVRCLYQFALFAYFLSYLTYGKQIKRTSFRLLVGVCVYKLLVANHRHPLTLKCTSMCSAFSSHPEIMNRILARLSDFSVACAYIIDGIPAHSFFFERLNEHLMLGQKFKWKIEIRSAGNTNRRENPRFSMN